MALLSPIQKLTASGVLLNAREAQSISSPTSGNNSSKYPVKFEF